MTDRFYVQIKDTTRYVNYAKFARLNNAILCCDLCRKQGKEARILDRENKIYITER